MSNQKSENAKTVEQIQNVLKNLAILRNRLTIVALIVILSLISYKLLSSYIDLDIVYKNLLKKVSSSSGLITTVITVFLVGVILSLVKLKQQFWYGILETVFALISCYSSAKNITADLPMLTVMLLFGSSIYLTVRGMSNVIDGVKKPFWSKKLFLEINKTLDSIPSKGLIDLLADSKSLVKVLSRIVTFMLRIT